MLSNSVNVSVCSVGKMFTLFIFWRPLGARRTVWVSAHCWRLYYNLFLY